MSKKQPEIKVIYPDASAAAMLLTDAMIRRSTGKRVVETNSEEKEYNGEALFGGVLSTKTDTSVELTLRLNPDAMDYALTMLVAKNLTEEEKRAIRMETDSMEIVDLLSSRAQAAQAPGQALDGDSSAGVPSAEREAATQSGEHEEKIEIGKISAEKLSGIIGKVVAAAWMDSGDEDSPTINQYIDRAMNEIREAANMPAESEEVREARNRIERYLAVLLYIAPDKDWDRADLVQRADDANDQLHPLINQEYPEDIRIQDLRNMVYQCEMIATRFGKTLTGDILEEELEKIQKGIETEKPKKAKKSRKKKQEPTWEDVEKEAQSLGKNKADKAEAERDEEIDAGLLDDIDTEGEGHAE